MKETTLFRSLHSTPLFEKQSVKYFYFTLEQSLESQKRFIRTQSTTFHSSSSVNMQSAILALISSLALRTFTMTSVAALPLFNFMSSVIN